MKETIPDEDTWTSSIHISCSECGYKGLAEIIPRTDPLHPNTTTFEMCCPNCRIAESVTEEED